MSNAMKYTKAGGTVGFRIIQKGHAPEGFADYDFVVKDNGIGMAITKDGWNYQSKK